MADHVRISKTLSYWLRHRPDKAALELDAQGWVSVDSILAALKEQRLPSDIDALLAVVDTNDKQRFELTPDLASIRARQGHSISIKLELPPLAPPPLLYHGTVERFIVSIMQSGLQKMRRHHVQLSPTQQTAERVGARRGAPIVLEIAAAAMYAEGSIFYVTENHVWLTDAVPPSFIRQLAPRATP